ncbi:MAG: 50S ribosomal protein L1 [Clostridia bacterium]
MSKRMKEISKLVEPGKVYDLNDALDILLKTAKVKFDETVEIHIKLGVDSKQADQQVRGVLVLPNGTGKTKKVLVLAKGDRAIDAEKAGADYVGDADLIAKIANDNWLDFDTIIATPDMMPSLGKVAKILGPKGLMPNPKSGTVTMDITKAVTETKAGKIEYRLDKNNIVHTVLGKVSFGKDKIKENYLSLLEAIVKAKPAVAKGTYLLSIAIATSMGVGIKVNTTSK